MASATISVTVTDTVNHPLAQVRDKLLIKWNAPEGLTAPQKLDFIEAHIAQYIKRQYLEQLDIESRAAIAASEGEVDIQQGQL